MKIRIKALDNGYDPTISFELELGFFFMEF